MKVRKLTMVLIGVLLFFTLHPSPFTLMSAYAASKGKGPVAYWRFDEGGGGSAYDQGWADADSDGIKDTGEAWSNNTGTLTPGAGANATAGQMWSRQGKVGGALECDGTDDYVSCGTNIGASLNGVSEISFSGWFKLNTIANDDGLFAIRLSGDGDWYWNIRPGGAAFWIGYKTSSGSGYRSITNPFTGEVGNWVYLMTTYASGHLKTYKNGVLIDDYTTPTGTVSISSSAGTYIGSYATPGSYAPDGLIDDFKIYTYARTADQIMVDYNAGMATYSGAGTDPNEGNPPVGYWKMDENTGTTAYDRSGNGNNGTVTGATWAAGKYGSSLNFNGTSDYVTIVSEPFTASDANYTISLWAKWDTIPTSSNMRYISWGNSGGRYFYGYNYSSQKIDVGHGGSVTITPTDASYKPTAGIWEQWAVTNSGTTTKFYRNGVLVDTVTHASTGAISTGSPVRIGRQYDTNTEYFDGQIDEVKIYNYTRTPAQVAYDYNKGKPVAQYRFDEGGGTIAKNDYGEAPAQPDKISGLKLWLKADAITGLSDGQAVSSWSDSSSNVHSAIQTDVNKKPIYKTNIINGNPVVRFDGADDVLGLVDNTGVAMSNVTMFVVHKMSSGATGNAYYPITLGAGDNVTGHYTGFETRNAPGGNSADICDVFGGYANDARATLTNISAFDEWKLWSSVSTGTIHNTKMYSSGSPATMSTTGSNVSLTVYAGNSDGTGFGGVGGVPSTLSNAAYKGDIAEVIAYSTALSTADLKSVEVYLRNKYNIVTSNTTHGTLVGDTKFVDGKIGKALQFDGSGDYIEIPDQANLNSDSQITVAAWIKPSAGDYRTIVSKGYSSSDGGYAIRIARDSEPIKLFFQVYNTGGTIGGAGVYSNIANGNWYHVVGTYDGSYVRLYINGVLNDSAALTGSIKSNTLPVRLGRLSTSAGATEYYSGLIDDVRIYNYTRTADQIMQDYNAGMSVNTGAQTGTADPWVGAMPVEYWKLDENTGIKAYDASGNGKDAILGGDGAGTDVPTWNQGMKGPCLKFDGSNDFVDTKLTRADLGTNYTIGAWFKYAGTAGRTYSAIIGGNEAATETFLGKNSGNTDIGWQDGNYISNMGSGTNAFDGNWHYLTVTMAGTTGKLYLDSKLINTQTFTGCNAAEGIYIGLETEGGGYGWDGFIDDVKIYNYVRTQAQIAWDYNKGKPVGYWRFDEAVSGAVSTAAGAIKDDSGTNNGTASNTTWTYTAGKFGGALSFDGNDSVNCGTNSSLSFGTGNFSISLWMKATGSDTYNAVFDKGAPGSGSAPGYQLFLSGGPLRYNISNGTGNWTELVVGNSPDMRDNIWHHVVWVYNGTDNKFYLDGRLLDTDPWTYGSGNPTASLLIGASWVQGFRGLMDDFRIYNYARTADQVLQDFNAGMAAKTSGD